MALTLFASCKEEGSVEGQTREVSFDHLQSLCRVPPILGYSNQAPAGQVHGHTAGVGVDVILALDVDLGPEETRRSERKRERERERERRKKSPGIRVSEGKQLSPEMAHPSR